VKLAAGIVILCALLAAGGAAAATAPAKKHTTAGNAEAKASLLTIKDFGSGFTKTKPGTLGVQLSCSGYTPTASGLVEIGSASSPNFSGGSAGPFVIQETSVFATAKQAAAYWKRAVKPGLIRCVAETLNAVSTKGIKVKILSEGPLSVAKVGPMSTDYRVVATLTSKTQTLKTYFDVLLVGSGRTLSEVTVSSFVSPVPKNLEHALALIVEHNISAPTA
jgi:hypothetical protein